MANYRWAAIFLVVLGLLLAGCKSADITQSSTITQASTLTTKASEQATISPSPVISLPSPSATQSATATQPAPTLSPSPVYPSPYPEAFLPPNLELIGADNINRLVQLTSIPVSEIYQLEFSPSGDLVATLSEPWDDRFNDYMEVWDLTTGQQILSVDHWKSPYGLFFPPDEKTLFADNRQYDLVSGEVITTLPVRPDDFMPDGEIYAKGIYLNDPEMSIVALFNLNSGMEVFSTTVPGMAMSLKFSPDSKWMSGGFQGNHFHVLVWDINSEKASADLIDYDANLTYSPDGSLAATTKNYQVYLFSGDKMTWLNTIGFSDQYANPYVQSFSINGDLLAVEDRNIISFLDPLSGRKLGSLANECYAKFSPNGKTILTWCYQTDIKIWGVMP